MFKESTTSFYSADVMEPQPYGARPLDCRAYGEATPIEMNVLSLLSHVQTEPRIQMHGMLVELNLSMGWTSASIRKQIHLQASK